MQSRWRLCSTFSNDRIYKRHKGRRPFNILHTGSEKFYPSRLQVKKSKKKGRAQPRPTKKLQVPCFALAHSLLEPLVYRLYPLKHRTHRYQRLYVDLYQSPVRQASY